MNIAIVNNQTQATDLPEEIRNAFKLFSLNVERNKVANYFRRLVIRYEQRLITLEECNAACKALASNILYVSYVATQRKFEIRPRKNSKTFYLFSSRNFCEIIEMIELYKKEINA